MFFFYYEMKGFVGFPQSEPKYLKWGVKIFFCIYFYGIWKNVFLLQFIYRKITIYFMLTNISVYGRIRQKSFHSNEVSDEDHHRHKTQNTRFDPIGRMQPWSQI